MAVLTDAQRASVWAEYMQDVQTGETYTLTKADLRAAVDALDTWLNDNAAAANTAIPQPARGALSAAQKARLMTRVIAQRYLVGA